MLKRILHFLLDKRNFVRFALYGDLFFHVLIRVFPYYFYREGWFVPTYNMASYICVFWGIFLLVADFYHHHIQKNRSELMLWVYTGFAILSIFVNQDLLTFSNFIQMIILINMTHTVFTMSKDYTREDFKQFITITAKYFMIAVMCVNAASFFLYLCGTYNLLLPFHLNQWYPWYFSGLPSKRTGTGVRFFGYYCNYSEICFYGYLSVLLGIYVFTQKKCNWLLLAFDIMFGCAAVWLGENRISMILIAFIAALILYFVLRKSLSERASASIIAALMAAGSIVYLRHASLWGGSSDVWIGYMKQFGFMEVLNWISSSRISKWEACLEGVAKKPLTGLGWQNTVLIDPHINETIVNQHNLFFNSLSWTGWIATILFFTVLLKGFIKIWKNRHVIRQEHEQWLAISVFCIFIQSLFDYAILGDQSGVTVWFWLVLGYFVFRKDEEIKHV